MRSPTTEPHLVPPSPSPSLPPSLPPSVPPSVRNAAAACHPHLYRHLAIAAMDMLLDYASDDDDDAHPSPVVASSSPMNSHLVPFTTPIAAPLPPPAPSLLPSAAQLFDAPASTTAASSSPSLPRKRPQVNGSAHPSHQPKVARSTSSSARTPPGSTLVPPQLRGRSNVATEDLDKLFVQRQQRRLE